MLKKRALFVLGGIAVFAVISSIVYVWQVLVTPLPVDSKGQLITVQAGISARSLANQLAQDKILAHPRIWLLYARLSGDAERIKQGQYRLKKGMTPVGLLDLLVSGRVTQYPVTLIPGWTFRQVMQALNANPHLSHTLPPSEYAGLIHRLGGPAGMSPQGWFYPNTYYVTEGTSDTSVLRRAYAAMKHYLDRQWAERAPDLPLKTPYQALILASIVDRETSVPKERPLIAGVFINRLRKGMPLQSDPTVIFALGASYKGNITFKDLRNPSPYNTYTHRGLPPTPIALPNPADIHAVLHPAKTPYLYFVATGNGTHVFSITYAEQKRAVAKYQLGGKQRQQEG